MQTEGSLQDTDLASLLETMQSKRATGTLNLEAGDDTCSLFFLFGHLFHATSPDGAGEAVVLRALSWREGNYRLDRRARLPARETVTSSPAELIAAAEEADRTAAAAVATESPSAEPSVDTISAAPWTAPVVEARDPGRTGPLPSARREPPLFPTSPSQTASRWRRQSSDKQRGDSTRP